MQQKNRDDGRGTALITGASSGIGLELAKVFAEKGHDVVLVARREDALEAAAGSIEGRYSVRATVLAADLRRRETPETIRDATRTLGVQYLVNNAGFGLGGAFTETPLERELELIQVNVVSVVALTKLFLQQMIHEKRGRIMNVASTAAFYPGPLASMYYASKAFVLSFSEAIAEELAGSGVTVTTLCPGPTSTEFAEVAGVQKVRLFTRVPAASACDVARYGYRAMMRGERVAIPGVQNKLAIQAERIAPRRLAARVVRLINTSR